MVVAPASYHGDPARKELEELRWRVRQVLGTEAAAQEELIHKFSTWELKGIIEEFEQVLQSAKPEQKHCESKPPHKALEIEETSRPGEFRNVCAWCGESCWLPFDLRSDFVCADAGNTCDPDKKAAFKRLMEDNIQEDSEGQLELHPNACAWCGETRYLPFDLGPNFVCRDVDLECDENGTNRQDSVCANVCAFCKSKCELPFDFGETFVCEMAGFECDYSNEEGIERDDSSSKKIFLNVCAECGAERELPFDLSANFVCGDAGLECSEELHPNVCIGCEKTRMLPFKIEEGFLCGDCSGNATRNRYEEVDLPDAPEEAEPDDGLTYEQRLAFYREKMRTQLLWKTLIQKIPLDEATKLFEAEDFEPPTAEELTDLRTNTLAHYRTKTMGQRQRQKSALKNKNKGKNQRYLNNELVTVGKKDKYVRSGGESLEDKAKTSVELYIIGIGRGGRHAVKIAKDVMLGTKKQGPMSNIHNKVRLVAK